MSRYNAAVETKGASFMTEAVDCFGETVAVAGSGSPAELARYRSSFKTGGAHTTTGIPYTIEGTAKVVQLDTVAHIAEFEDAIGAILGRSVCESATVVITKKYVVGHDAIITPEHAPARSVAIKEEVREVRLTRYGGDIDMNLNLFLIPGEAKKEFEMKMTAQRFELERMLVKLAYKAVLGEAISVQAALARVMPGVSKTGLAKKIYINSVFGAMAKHAFPVANLLSAARHANMYQAHGTKTPVLLVPPGMLDIAKYTRPEAMLYSVGGFKQSEAVEVMHPNAAYFEPQLGVRIVVAKPSPRAMNPYAVGLSNGGHLIEVATWATYYVIENDVRFEYGVVNHETGVIEKVDGSGGGGMLAPPLASGGGGVPPPSGGTPRNPLTAAELRTIKAVSNTVPTSAGYGEVTVSSWKTGGQKGTYTNLGGFVNSQYAAETAAFAAATHVALIGTTLHFWKAAVSSGGAGGVPVSVPPPPPAVGAAYTLLRPKMEAWMGSAILCTDPGAETGEMLFGFPSTGLKTDQEKETMKCMLRMYLGTAIYRKDNLLKLEHVSFEGIKSGGGGMGSLVRTTLSPDSNGIIVTADGLDAYAGAVYMRAENATGTASWTLHTKNEGHLGILDDPEQTDRLHGMHKFGATKAL
jgi:hypothetical protein